MSEPLPVLGWRKDAEGAGKWVIGAIRPRKNRLVVDEATIAWVARWAFHWGALELRRTSQAYGRSNDPKPICTCPDIVCEHGTAMDVHCCNCHSGFIFDPTHECPVADLTEREVKLGVIEFHSEQVNPGLIERFYEVRDDLVAAGAIVDLWLLDIQSVLAEHGYRMRVFTDKPLPKPCYEIEDKGVNRG